MKEVSFKIDGKTYKAPLGENLIMAAKRNGVYIPTLCYLEGHPCLGTCRVCTIRVNGRSMAACTLTLTENMQLEVNTSELQDMRKAIVELIFVEGNHFCPACEKGGDCQLQAVAYAMDMRVARFHYSFSPYRIHYEGKNIILEHNRCMHCKRCTNLFQDDQGYKIFSFINRGSKTRVMIDLDREKLLSAEKLREAKQLCPTGAILLQGGGFDRAIGTRQYDQRPIGVIPKGEK
ncbi:MAG: (2Fe-2S)-binding protein [Bdellovibrio sp.]|nr:(2Fe-2S)-binding protein [Bdellovibrio sp.]